MIVVYRSDENPVLLPKRENTWEALAAFNGSVAKGGRKIHLVYRAQSSPQNYNGAVLSMASAGYASSSDGIHFKNRKQLFKPEYDWEKFGCEDPRITKFKGDYFIFYTALSSFPFSAGGIKIGVAVTKDFKKLEKHPVTTFNSKAAALFPEKINGKMAVVLTANTDKPPAKIALALFDKAEDIWSRAFWEKWYADLDSHVIPLLRRGEDHIEVGAPPIKTKYGWLLVYSYIRNYFSGSKIFGIEAVLLDLNDPRKIRGRTEDPLIFPQEEYELYGSVPNIVFPSGALVKDGILSIYYGTTDTTCSLATCRIKDLIDDMLLASRAPKLKRFIGNPIIEPNPAHSWEEKAVFNPAAIFEGGKVHLLYRAMSRDNTSVLGYAATEDGFDIKERLNEPVYLPREDFEKKLAPGGNSGCEDPRLTRIGDKIYICYTAFDGRNPPRVAFSSISVSDFLAKNWNWEKPVLISPPGMDDKDAALFPKKIKGKYVFLHRPGGISIWLDFVDDLKFDGAKWLGGRVLMNPRQGEHDSRRIGLAGPPIETEKGWLVLYHGISRREDHHYHARAVLLDLADPTKILARTPNRVPLLEPDMPYERVGETNNVVFPCGAAVLGERLFVYYGAADKVIGVATMKLADLLELLFHSAKYQAIV